MQFGRWSVDRFLSDYGDFFILTLDIWMEQFKNKFNELFQYNQKMYVDKHTHTHTHTNRDTHTHTHKTCAQRTHTCTHTHTHTQTHRHTHTHTLCTMYTQHTHTLC